jgi:hypothetical protein
MLQIQSPFQQLFDTNGSPLDDGYVYIGTANANPETSPIAIYWDDAGTIPAAQPLRTLNGYIVRSGTPARVYTALEDFSMTVKDKQGRVVFSVLDATSLSNLQNNLAASGGSALVGFLQAGVDAQIRTVQSKLRDVISVKDFGAIGNGLADDTDAIIRAQNAVAAQGGGTVFFPAGEYKITSPITMQPQVTYRGPGKAGLLDYYPNKAKIFSVNSDIFRNSADMITEVCFRDLVIESQTGGGHIFDWSFSGIVAKTEVDGCALLQRNAAKSVLFGSGASTYIGSLWMHDFEFAYAPANTNPAIWIASTTVNSIVIDKFWSTCTAQNSTGKPAIWIESRNPGGAAFNITVRDGVFEFPASGSVRLLSVSHAIIDNCTTYDLSIPTGYYQFSVDKGATGPSSTQITIRNCRSTVGSATWSDLYLNLNAPGQGAFLIDGCTFSHTNGGTLTGPYTQVINSTLGTVANLAYTEFNAGAIEPIVFKNTDPTAAKVALWNGYPGNENGFFNISIDNVIRGRIRKDGFFFWGPSPTSGAYISPSGIINAGAHLYPGTPGGAQQQASGFLAGTGAPTIGGNDGDFYFRSDGGAGTTIYQKRAGLWVGIV